jgi:hypothetical protein
VILPKEEILGSQKLLEIIGRKLFILNGGLILIKEQKMKSLVMILIFEYRRNKL